uniref:BTB/POZ domain-containing protein FBL11 n=2 Tax=Rhizophora mucronata TaxID=61149 RepID=A0A2P2LXC5_RHIMU
MASSYDNDFVILSCANPSPIEYKEILISTADIHGWDLPTNLRYQTLKIKALRSRLVEQSSYFHGLLSGSFSESNLETVSVQWNLETFLNVLNFLYGHTLDVTSKNFLLLFEAALYFGIETLLLKCKSWFSEVSSSTGPQLPEIQLDDLIHIWNFGIQHANDFVPELCASYLARNFMWAMSNKFFRDIPYDLLLNCIKHPHLTIYSEMYLCEALLFWLDSSSKEFEPVSKFLDDRIDILKQVCSWKLKSAIFGDHGYSF